MVDLSTLQTLTRGYTRTNPFPSVRNIPPYDPGHRWLDMEIAAVAAGAAGSLFGSLEENRICGLGSLAKWVIASLILQ